MNDPIICSGNDLAGVCADIRARGGVVESLNTGVGGNAGYRVNYFECVAELADASVAGGDRSRKLPSLAIEGSIPSAPAIVISDCPGVVENADLGRRDDLSIEDRMAALQARLAASGKLRGRRTLEARLPYRD